MPGRRQFLRNATANWADAIRESGGKSDAEAKAEVVSALVPGVILQPSGVFAAILAQEHGCAYLHAG